jgi:hypothetical protein
MVVNLTKDAHHAERPKTATSEEMVPKMKEIVYIDVRYSIRQIANIVGISKGAAHTILKHDLKMNTICVR